MDDVDAGDEDALRRAWAGGADAQDELAVVEGLLEALPDDELGVPRARVLLLSGRPAEALRLLPDASAEEVLAGRPRGWGALVAAACWAAQGDERALGALMLQGADLTGGAARTHTYLVAGAAEQANRLDVADQAWRLLFDSGPVTDLVFVRTLTAQVARRDPRDADRAAAEVLDAAQALLNWHGADPYGIARVREVADRLVARGDRVGAGLLTAALVQMRPGNPRLAEVHRRHALTRSPVLEHGTQVAGVLAGAALFALAVAGVLPSLVGTGGVVLALLASVHRLRSVRGLSALDDSVLRKVEGAPLDVPEGLPWLTRAPAPLVVAVLLSMSAVLAFLATYLVALALVSPDLELGDDPVVDALVAGATVVATIGLVAVQVRLRRRTIARQAERRRTVDHGAWALTVGECRCWTDEAFKAPLAGEYLTRHLRPTTDAVASALAASAGSAGVAQCPLTGARWLVLTDADGQVRYVLRGPAVVAPEPAPVREVGGYL